MTLHTALVQSCDTVFYQLAYDIWRRDNPQANVVTSNHAPVQKMQKMELAWGFGRTTGIDLPQESPGTVPTRAWLYRFYTQHKKLWCGQGNQYGSYAQRIAYEDCHYGNVWEPGQAVDAAIGQGYVTVTPLQLASAYAALANGGTLYSPRIGAALVRPDGRLVRRIVPPVVGHLPVAKPVLALYQARAGRRDDAGHGRARLQRLSVAHGVRRRKDRHCPGRRQARDLGIRVIRAVRSPKVCRRDDDPCLRLRRRRVRASGAADLGRASMASKVTRRRCQAAGCHESRRPSSRTRSATRAVPGPPGRRPVAAARRGRGTAAHRCSPGSRSSGASTGSCSQR